MIKLQVEGIERDQEGVKYYKFTDEDKKFVEELLGNSPLIEVKIDNRDTGNSTLSVGLAKTEYTNGGILNLTDSFRQKLDERFKEFGELICNNTGSIFWVNIPFENKLK